MSTEKRNTQATKRAKMTDCAKQKTETETGRIISKGKQIQTSKTIKKLTRADLHKHESSNDYAKKDCLNDQLIDTCILKYYRINYMLMN